MKVRMFMRGRTGSRRRRGVSALVAVLGASAVAATIAGAGPAPATVSVSAAPTTITVAPSGPLPAGPTRFEVQRQGNKDLSVYFVLLNTGVSLDEFQKQLASDDRTGGDAALGLASIQASLSVSGSASKRAVTFSLRPGVTYHVISELDDQPERKARKRGTTSFTSSTAASGATPAAPDATIRMRGLRFRGAARLPRSGVVRVENNDGVAHFAAAFPVRKTTTSKRLGRALRSNSERAFGSLIAGEPYGLQNLLSGGNTSNDNEVRFPKAGRYALVCFIFEHHKLGMYRIVTVK